MFGILLIYFIGKYYYKLAEESKRSKWGFAIIGIVVYYAGIFIGGIIAVVLLEIFGTTPIEEYSDMTVGLMGVPFGILACWGLYKILKSNWGKQAHRYDPEILDAEILNKDY